MSTFQASKDGMKDTGMNYLAVPYLGPAKLSNVSLEKVGDVDNCIKFKFILEGEDIEGNNANGVEHEHVEWAPNDADPEDSTQKKVDRIAYIASRIVPEEKVEAVQATNWVDYCKAIIQLMEQHGYQTKDLVIKVLGNVWKDKVRVKFPGYNSFITTPDGKPLTLSPNEKKQNAEYLQAVASKPTSDPSDSNAASLTDVDEAGF